MQKILEDIYHGRFRPDEALHPQNPDYKAAFDAVLAQEHELLDSLPPEQSTRIQRLIEEQTQANSYETCQSFVDGFRFGVRLMLEALDDSCSA